MRLLSWAQWVTFATASAIGASDKRATNRIKLSPTPPKPLLPSEDRFYYEEPVNLAAYTPGSIIRARRAPGNLTSLFGNCSDVYNIAYRTTDARNEPSWAITTIMKPTNPYTKPSPAEGGKVGRHGGHGGHDGHGRGRGTAVLSFGVAYDTPDVDHSPSAILYDLDELPGSYEFMQPCLDRGWYVNVADYEGPTAAFGSGFQSAHAELDSLRAVRHLAAGLPALGLDPDADLALMGYSGGTVAGEWAAELREEYAPDVDIAGVVVGGPITNYLDIFRDITGTMYAGLAAAGLVGVTAQFPDVREYMVSHLKTDGPRNATGLLGVLDMGLFEILAAFAMQDIGDYFIGGYDDIESDPLGSLLAQQTNMGGHGSPKMPMFWFRAVDDEFGPQSNIDAIVDNLCDNEGANILFHRNLQGDHSQEAIVGIPRALPWLESIFDGSYSEKYQAEGCTIIDVNITP